jgi:predicted ester cyclase
MAQDNATIVRSFVDEVITRGNIEAAAQYVWEDVVEQVPLPGQGPGLEGLKDIIRAMRAGFPDIIFSIQDKLRSMTELPAASNGPAPTTVHFSAFPQPGGMCTSGGL